VVLVCPPLPLDDSVPLPTRLLEVDPGEDDDDDEALLQFVTITPGLMQPSVLDVIVHVPSVEMSGHVIEDAGRPPDTTHLELSPTVHETASQQADPPCNFPPTACNEAHKAALCITVYSPPESPTPIETEIHVGPVQLIVAC